MLILRHAQDERYWWPRRESLMVSLSNHERYVRLFAAFAVFAALASIGCGRKGPPLPPLLKMPAAPGEMRAERHGSTVDVEFSVPTANTDGTRPANVSRIDVYALSADRAVNEADVIKFGTKIASLNVK